MASRGGVPVEQQRRRVSRPAIRQANLDDYERIAALQVRNGLAAMPRASWTVLWSKNPACRRMKRPWPIGWVLETECDIVGFIASIPAAYRFRGRDLLAAVTGSWVTDPGYRAYSMMVLKAVVQQANADLLLTNTANSKSEATLRMLRWSRVPVGAWDRLYFWVANYSGFATWLLQDRRMPLAGVLAVPLSLLLRLGDFWPRPASPIAPPSDDVEICSDFDARFDTFWDEIETRSQGVLLGLRSREALQWHFNSALTRGAVWILTRTRASRITAYAIFDRRDTHGLNRARLVDFQALEDAPDALSSFLSWILHEIRRAGVHVLESPAFPLRSLGNAARVAPYGRTLDAWRYYYKANTDELSRALASPEAWAPSYFDGDASL